MVKDLMELLIKIQDKLISLEKRITLLEEDVDELFSLVQNNDNYLKDVYFVADCDFFSNDDDSEDD